MARIETLRSDRALDGVSLSHGAIGGVIAGLVYSTFALIINVVQNGADTFFFPLRQIGAVVLGVEALAPAYDLTTAVAAGLVVHVVLSAFYGVVFAALMRAMDIRSTPVLAILGAVYGLAFYLVNLFVIFPAAFPWFLANDPMTQAFGHAVMFGAVTGAWLGTNRAH